MSSKRRKNAAARAARKAARGKPGKGKSRFALKKMGQQRGRFSPGSPFRAAPEVETASETAA